jgi:isoquinoline 1-oxidoreductase beta subunit
MTLYTHYSRRSFLKQSTSAAAAFTVGLHLGACKTIAGSLQTSDSQMFQANAWLTLRSDSTYEFMLDKTEMGQGAMTGLATIIAEALNITPQALQIKFAPANRVYNNIDLGLQVTGGSTSVKASYKPLLKAGAMMKHAILRAAALSTKTNIKNLKLVGTEVQDQTGKKIANIGTLIPLMNSENLDDIKAEKIPTKGNFVGIFDRRLDAKAKVMGSARFGIDVQGIANKTPDIAIIMRSPVLASSSNEKVDLKALEKHTAVKKALAFDFGVVLIGPSFGQLKLAAAELAPQIKWKPADKNWTSAAIDKKMLSLKDSTDASEITDQGDIKVASNQSDTIIEAQYDAPYLAHAPMEPMNATAHVKDGRCNIIAPTQNPGLVRAAVAASLGLNENDVDVEVTFLGGGFGRRLEADYAVEAALIAQAHKGPVKVMWTREDDMSSGPFRPIAKHFFRGGIKNGKAWFWQHQVITPSIMRQRAKHWVVGMMPSWSPSWLSSSAGSVATSLIELSGKDSTSFEGADKLSYNIPNIRVTNIDPDIDVPVCFFRAVGHSHTGFAVECFIDEMAVAAKKDPYQFRRDLLKQDTRQLAVLELAAEKSGWKEKPAADVFRGIAVHYSFKSYVAMVAQIRKSNTGALKIEKFVAAVDCGKIINPDIVRMQVESGIIFGLSMALKSEITLKDGVVEQTNFHQYEVLRMSDHPEIEVHIIDSNVSPTGIGEPGVPPVAAALANALFQASGKRQRKMPFKLT